MISENQGLAFAIGLSLLGLLALYYYSLISFPEPISISDISLSQLNHRVRVHGFVSSAYERNSILYLQLRDNNSSISAMLFHPSLEQKAILQPRSFVTVIARVTEYDHVLRLRVDSVIEYVP